ncbi:hypothetical protein DIPPA_70197 [Diplonema papillatum]|nr:hypothetical protein DIPPA_70197 [Diplonema papillatum]
MADTGMHELLPVVNRLQDVFSRINMVHEFDLPQIVVVGAQSSGKSSVLENVVGKDFLPRGSGIVTRRPLILHMSHLSNEEHQRKVNAGEPTETASFAHQPGKIYTDFDAVKAEIEAETARKCGDSKGVDSEPIRLSVTSNYVVDLTLIDLPGLTKVAVEGQKETVAADIESMVIEWSKPRNTIILAVTAANTDIANSDALQLAKRVDPSGDRTIGVLTKIDLMDQGTDCLDILKGNVVKLKKGFYGLVNRSQRDIDSKKDIKAALAAERQFFETHPAYKANAARMGTPFLTRVLSQELMFHIKKVLPQLKENISSLLEQTEEVLRQLGENPVSDASKRTVLLNLLQEYSNSVKNNLDGTVMHGKEGEIRATRGAKIKGICSNGYVSHLRRYQPLRDLTDQQILNVISSSQGTRNKLFIPEQAFTHLVRKSIADLLQPAIRCVEYVHEELLFLIDDAAPVLARFPNLLYAVSEFTKDLFLQYKKPLTGFIEDLIQIEMAHMNTNHPAFYNGGSIDELISTWTLKGTPHTDDEDTDEADPLAQTLVEKQERETMLFRQLVTAYMKIVNGHLQDHVPKAVSLFFVDKLRDNLYTSLVEEFYKNELFDQLLEEGDDVARRRKASREMLSCLKEANEALAKARDYRIS